MTQSIVPQKVLTVAAYSSALYALYTLNSHIRLFVISFSCDVLELFVASVFIHNILIFTGTYFLH